MEFEKMSVDEIIEYLFKEQNHISTTDLSNALDACSIVDTCAGPNALTIFYSGGEDQIINTIANTNNPNVRLIRRTDGFKLMTAEVDGVSFNDLVEIAIDNEYSTLSESERKIKVNDFLYKTSAANDPSLDLNQGQGLWTKLSSRFAADTKLRKF